MGKTLKILLLVAVAGVALQVGNRLGVHSRLCGLSDVGCSSVFVPGDIEGRWQGSESLPSAVRGAVVGFTAATALIRKKCDGTWTANIGARIATRAFRIAESFASEGGCADVGFDGRRIALRAELQGARVSSAECSLALAPLRLEWNEVLNVEAGTSLDTSTAASCATLVSASSGAAAALSGARLALAARYAVPFGSRGASEPADAASALPAMAGGWIRSALGATATAHTLSFDGAQGAATLRLASTPPPAGARSPELSFELTVDERVREALPADFLGYLNEAGSLRVRWNMDHENGYVTVDDTRIERGPQSFRPAGSGEPTAAECSSEDTAKLLFVEADDEGRGNDGQLGAAFAALESAAAGGQVVVTVFVHGWQHSAAPGDSYVCSFAALVRAIEAMEQERVRASGRRPRAVLGVYVGWPGALYPHTAANLVTTFWNRLEVADRLGAEGAVLPRLIRGLVERLPAREGGADRSSALVVAGHSLGARAVFGAVRGDIIARAEAVLPDLVLLVNPAFSADLYTQVHEQRCAPGTPLLLFSSETDSVTRQVYPAGQTLSYRYAAEPPTPFLEHIYTAANFSEFVTHELSMDPGSNVPPPPDGEQTIRRGFQRVPNGTDLYSDITVPVYRQPSSGRPRSADLWYTMRLEPTGATAAPCETAGAKVIAVDTRILPNHGEIFTPPFMEYVVRALNVALGRAE